MTDRPILFSPPMVRALLNGRKTQTRRMMNPQPYYHGNNRWQYKGSEWGIDRIPIGPGLHSPLDFCKWQPGDLLWVRETFALEHNVEGEEPTHTDNRPIKRRPADDVDGYLPLWVQPHYRATDPAAELAYDDSNEPACRWKPSIHMPRWASRLTLELTAVRVERLQDITEMDAYAEGIDTEGDAYIIAEHGKLGGASGPAASVCAYADLWDSINGPGSWDANPWVWALTFKVHRCNINQGVTTKGSGGNNGV